MLTLGEALWEVESQRRRRKCARWSFILRGRAHDVVLLRLGAKRTPPCSLWRQHLRLQAFQIERGAPVNHWADVVFRLRLAGEWLYVVVASTVHQSQRLGQRISMRSLRLGRFPVLPKIQFQEG